MDIAPDAEILVLYNFEVVHYLIKECKVDPSQITLYTQSRLKAELAEACGVNVRVGEHPLDL